MSQVYVVNMDCFDGYSSTVLLVETDFNKAKAFVETKVNRWKNMEGGIVPYMYTIVEMTIGQEYGETLYCSEKQEE